MLIDSTRTKSSGKRVYSYYRQPPQFIDSASPVMSSKHMYVVSSYNFLTVISVNTQTITNVFPTPEGLESIAWDGGDYLYVGPHSSDHVYRVLISDGTFSAPITVGARTQIAPGGIAYDGSGHIYVCNDVDNTVSRINVVTGTVDMTITGLAMPVAITYDGAGHMYVANDGDDSVKTILITTGVVDGSIGVIDHPRGLALAGLYMYVCINGFTSNMQRITLSTNVVDTVIDMPSGIFPYSAAADNTDHVWVIGSNGSGLQCIDVVTNTFINLISTYSSNPQYAIAYDGVGRVYTTCAATGTLPVNLITNIDGVVDLMLDIGMPSNGICLGP